MGYTLKDIYIKYISEKEYVDKKTFTAICSEFNMDMIDHILDGGTFSMGNRLSSLSVVRVETNPSFPKIDWGESLKYKKELEGKGIALYNSDTGKGVKWYIYHTNSEYCRYFWRKGKCLIPNKSVYRLDLTRGIKGNKEKLIHLLSTDDLAYLKFKKN
tara:strand:+ start:1683 stop:2156 length:474 start_codon:yes stop_codon:yes gene_type:complete